AEPRLELDPLASSQTRALRRADDVRPAHVEMISALVRGNEAVAARLVEPHDGPGCHDSHLPFLERIREGAEAPPVTRPRVAVSLAPPATPDGTRARRRWLGARPDALDVSPPPRLRPS